MKISSKKIKRLRNIFGFSQAELAEKVDVSQGYISRLEQDEHTPSVEVAGRIAAAFGLTVEKICE